MRDIFFTKKINMLRVSRDTIDKELCELLGIPVNKKNYAASWHAEFQMHMLYTEGATISNIGSDPNVTAYTKGDELKALVLIGKYLDENYTVEVREPRCNGEC